MQKNTLLSALVLLSLSGFLLHFRIHNFMVPDPLHPGMTMFDGRSFFASSFSLVDLVAVTALFLSRRTVVYGYLLNGLIAIYGTIFMAHFSIAEILAKGIPFKAMVLKSTLPDIGIVWGDFLIGKALYDAHLKGDPPQGEHSSSPAGDC